MSRIRTNTLALGSSFFVTAFLAFLQVKIVTNFLDQDSVGVWSAVIAVGAVLSSFSEMGLPWVLLRYGAKYDAEGRLARLPKLWRFAAGMNLPAIALMVVVLIFLGPKISGLLGEGLVDRWLLVLGYLAVATGSLRAFNNASFRGLRRMVAVAVLEISLAVTVTLGYFLFRNQLSVSLVLTVALCSGLFWTLAGMLHLFRLFGPYRASAPEIQKPPVFPEVKHFWQGAAATGIFLVAIEQLDKPLLAGLVSFQELAVFHVAARLALFARRLIFVPFQVMTPEITHKWESDRREELRADMELFSKLALGLGLFLVLFLAIFAGPLILLVSTPEFLSGRPVLWVFLGVIPLICLHQPMVMFLRATGKVWYSFAGDATWLVTYLGVGAILVREFGLPGFVAGQLVASSIILTYTLTVFHRLGLPRPQLSFFLKRLVLGAAVWGAGFLGGRFLPPLPVGQLVLLAAGIAVLVNFAFVRGRFLTPAEEKRTVDMLAGRGVLGRAARFVLTWPRFGAAPGTSGG